LPRGSERLLLVGGDPGTRRFLCQLLASLGYRISESDPALPQAGVLILS
jgi:hypothetical protein